MIPFPEEYNSILIKKIILCNMPEIPKMNPKNKYSNRFLSLYDQKSFPKQCGHTRVLTVIVKHRCLLEVSRQLFRVHSCLSKSSKCISTAQACKIWVCAAGAYRDCALAVVPRAFSDMGVTFRG